MQTVKKYNVFLREVTLIVRALAQYFTLPVRGVVLTRRFSTVSYPDGALTPEARHPLRKEKTRQFLTSNGETIVCVHPAAPQDFADTKPLRPYNPQLALQRKTLDPDEVAFVKKLRAEDPSLWSVATLARLFNVKRIVISQVAPADKTWQEELVREKRLMARMKSYKRKLYLAERHMKRQIKLEQVIKEKGYKFPGTVQNNIL